MFGNVPKLRFDISALTISNISRVDSRRRPIMCPPFGTQKFLACLAPPSQNSLTHFIAGRRCGRIKAAGDEF